MRFPSVFLVLFLCSSAFAQCENGQCRVPVRNAVKQIFQATQTVVQAQPIRSAVRGVYQSVSSVQQSKSYGSSGSLAVGYSSSGSAYGYDVDGAKIEWVGVGVVVQPSMQSEVSSLGVRQRRASREVIVEAAVKANAEGAIDDAQLRAIKLASRSPRMLARMEDLVLEKAQSSGAYSFALDANGDVVKAKVDWEAIGDFILKLAPLIFKLIEMFVLDTSPQAQSMFAFDEPIPLNFVATVGQFSGC